MQIVGAKIKRSLVLGAAKTTLLETEELKTRTAEEVAKLTEKLFANGARHTRASDALIAAENSTDDEMLLSLAEFDAIREHIPER